MADLQSRESHGEKRHRRAQRPVEASAPAATAAEQLHMYSEEAGAASLYSFSGLSSWGDAASTRSLFSAVAHDAVDQEGGDGSSAARALARRRKRLPHSHSLSSFRERACRPQWLARNNTLRMKTKLAAAPAATGSSPNSSLPPSPTSRRRTRQPTVQRPVLDIEVEREDTAEDGLPPEQLDSPATVTATDAAAEAKAALLQPTPDPSLCVNYGWIRRRRPVCTSSC